MPIFRADLLQMDHKWAIRQFKKMDHCRQNGPTPVGGGGGGGTGRARPNQPAPQLHGVQTETPAEREGTAGVPVTGPFRRGSMTEVPPWELTAGDLSG
jgi:hypothetical protein